MKDTKANKMSVNLLKEGKKKKKKKRNCQGETEKNKKVTQREQEVIQETVMSGRACSAKRKSSKYKHQGPEQYENWCSS